MARQELQTLLGSHNPKDFINDPSKAVKYAKTLQLLMKEIQYDRLTRYHLYDHQKKIFEAPHAISTAVLAGNRSGKSMAAAFSCAVHATGKYPSWWTDVRYKKATIIYVGGESSDQLKLSMQLHLIGTSDKRDMAALGTGLIPRDCLVLESVISGQRADSVKSIRVRHESGGHSQIIFFTYSQAREAIQGGAADAIYFDEQPPEDVVAELLRAIAIPPSGQEPRVLFSFTPLLGRTPTVARHLEGAPQTKAVTFTWDDVPTSLLPQNTRDALMAQWPEYELEARVYGRPAVGLGRVFAINLRKSCCYDHNIISIKDHWFRCIGVDPGRSPDPTAVCYLAWDKENDIIYAYDLLMIYNQTPIEYAPQLLARGKEWPMILPRDAKRQGYTETSSLRDELTYKYGLNVMPEAFCNPDEQKTIGIDYGVQYILQRMRTGRFKINAELEPLLIELENYHTERLLSGKLEFRGQCHAIDALRYGALSIERFGASRLSLDKLYNPQQYHQDKQYIERYDEYRY